MRERAVRERAVRDLDRIVQRDDRPSAAVSIYIFQARAKTRCDDGGRIRQGCNRNLGSAFVVIKIRKFTKWNNEYIILVSDIC